MLRIITMFGLKLMLFGGLIILVGTVIGGDFVRVTVLVGSVLIPFFLSGVGSSYLLFYMVAMGKGQLKLEACVISVGVFLIQFIIWSLVYRETMAATVEGAARWVWYLLR